MNAMFDYADDQQRTDEWREDRSGCFTASRFADLAWERGVYKTGDRKGQEKPAPKSRTNYIAQVVAEILTGKPSDSVTARALEYGTEMEPQAMAVYDPRRGLLVGVCGFVRHPLYPFAGASPDFLVGDDGGGEIKCPMSRTVHAITLRDGLPPEHIEQIQGGLWVTGRKWWDFVSYNPDFPTGLDLYVQRIERDSEVIARIELDVVSAWNDVQATISQLEELRAA